ncbi:hypothetical protein MY04_2947 [Flammeovirga sp. MY04]|uniref:hypothetical protein n=1 Tax=Flammeovirga sp. MY04 TaxID=1191459 RepID=UPI0013052993|nr:hypothetical protein [Flammeovirga sp. MY04]ANQ50315.2 hypothetical protein MY04_2947 [Flammeovirga sp. MY04]
MKLKFLFCVVSLFLMLGSCNKSENQNEVEKDDSIFDGFEGWFDDTEETVKKEELLPQKVEARPEPTLQKATTKVEHKELSEEESLTEEEVEAEEASVDATEVDLTEEEKKVSNLKTYSFDNIGVMFSSERDVTFNEVEIDKKLVEKGLLYRYKTTYSYFDVYDMDKSIEWSGAGDFAEFGQGFYERSKLVSNGKYTVFAGRRAYTFDAKASLTDDYNYSNIKKLKSDIDIDEDDLVDVKIVFFGRKNLGYRIIYSATDPYINSLERSAILYEPK